MSKQVVTVDAAARLTLPPEAIEALGLQPGDEVDVEIVGRAIVVRSMAEANRAGEFAKSFERIFERRCGAYEQLAEGAE